MVRLLLVGLTVASVAAAVSMPTPAPARAIKVRVMVKGVLVLEGGISDSGVQDVDDVWRMVVERTEANPSLTLRQTKAFQRQFVQLNKNGATVLRDPDKSKVTISVSYGGQADVRELKLSGKTETEREIRWGLDAGQLKQLFERRLIRRKDASRLKHPTKHEY